MPLAARQASAALRPHACPGPHSQPFASAEAAWLWTMAALTARREGARHSTSEGRLPRPCEPDDVITYLDTLYRQRRIDLAHARVLRLWGERRTPPAATIAAERHDYRLWTEALERLEWPLRIKGIVAS
jgi:hypothetical protein